MAQTVISTKQLPVVTEIDETGDDTHIPTEQAVREAITANVNSIQNKIYIFNMYR